MFGNLFINFLINSAHIIRIFRVCSIDIKTVTTLGAMNQTQMLHVYRTIIHVGNKNASNGLFLFRCSFDREPFNYLPLSQRYSGRNVDMLMQFCAKRA